MIIIISLLVAMVLYLFTFYYYVRDDLYFIRKGVSMEQLFNVLFLGLFGGVISSRLLYIFLDSNFQNVSKVQSYFISRSVGISIFGAVAGLIISYIWLTKRNKISMRRFFDYVSVALLAAFPILFLGVFSNLYLFVMYVILFMFFTSVLMPKYINGRMRVGSICLIFLIMFSLVSFLHDIFLLYTENILLSKESFLFIGLFVLSFILLIRLEMKKIQKSS